MQGPRLRSHSSAGKLPSFLLINSTTTKSEQNQNNDIDSITSNYPTQENIMQTEKGESNEDGDEPPIGGEGREESKESRMQMVKRVVMKQASFLGPGVIAAVAYIDPGNWATDLQSGSSYGYSQLFVVLLAGLIALLFQILCTRLGSVTGLDLAQQCRVALHDRPKHKMFYRWGMLYPLYAISEAGIILTDLAELLGSAIAINLIFPAIPLPVCVVLTALDVILILLLFDQYPMKFVTRSMRLFELMIGVLMVVVLGSFIALLVKIQPVWSDVFVGYVPSAGIVNNGGIYSAVGILGATIMLHALFLGSKVATMRRVQPSEYEKLSSSTDLTRAPSPSPPSTAAVRDQIIYELPNSSTPKPTLACVRAHLPYAQIDITFSLLCFAIVINSAILIVASAVFYYGADSVETGADTGGISNLFDAYDLVRGVIGPAFGYLFAIGLFAAGQAASLTVTLSGQIISEGFIRWKTVPWKRRLVTRAIGIIPSLVVAIAVGKDGIDVLLVGSQVGLSIILPFVIFPLIIFTSSHHLMAIPIDPTATPPPSLPITTTSSTTSSSLDLESASPSPLSPSSPPYFFPSLVNSTSSSTSTSLKQIMKTLNPFRRRESPEGTVSFVNSVAIIYLAGFLFLAINAANLYALVELGMGAGA